MRVRKTKVLRERLERAEKLVPTVLELCEKSNIKVDQNDHGFQFRKAEYVILWSPRTNKIAVQYKVRGHDKTTKFAGDSRAQKSKIIQALESLLEVSK